ESADLELARSGDIGPGRHAGMIIDRRERPAGLLRRGCEAAEEPGKPEAHAAFVGTRSLRNEDARGGQDCDRSIAFTAQAPAATCLSDSRHVRTRPLPGTQRRCPRRRPSQRDGKMLQHPVATCRASAASSVTLSDIRLWPTSGALPLLVGSKHEYSRM